MIGTDCEGTTVPGLDVDLFMAGTPRVGGLSGMCAQNCMDAAPVVLDEW